MGASLYTTREIEPCVYQITDALDDRAYLVVGKRSAVLVDSCMGYGDISATVRELTSLPVRVLLTHAHYDHVGGAYFFGEASVAVADDGAWDYEKGLAMRAHEQMVDCDTFDPGVEFGPRDNACLRVRHVVEGDVFDLGGLTVEVVGLPGHTPGSVGYLVREQRVLLSGDAVTPIMCLFFPNSLGIPAYRDTLAKMSGLSFDRFYTGHHGVSFAKDDLASFDATAIWAQEHRGIAWQHALFEEYKGTAHLAPCDTMDADSPDFRALIGP